MDNEQLCAVLLHLQLDAQRRLEAAQAYFDDTMALIQKHGCDAPPIPPGNGENPLSQ